ncbi:MAG: C1 family peptidase [Holophaga sp.]|nr:C1 family peptidase [Holophaga sp.]
MFLSRIALCLTLPLLAQAPPAPMATPKPQRTFTIETELKRSDVKSQGKTGTCWCFATTSYMESELQRLGKGDIGLSEAFVVRNTYPAKAWHYYRNQASVVWSPGGQAHDWIDTVKAYGIVPREAYTGMLPGEKEHNHGELHSGMKAFMDVVAKGKQPSNHFPAVLTSMMDIYLGPTPATFTFQGKSHTPQSFRDSLGLNLDDYVEISSFTHHPMYQPFRLEVQDNWSQNSRYYNVPLNELEEVMTHALRNGYTFAWDGDMSEKSFDQKNLGYAYLPKEFDPKAEPVKVEPAKTEVKTETKPEPLKPEPELEVTQELRQKSFDDFRTTDDHLMHIVGLAKDQEGTPFFITKNSWGEKNGPNKGYVYMSRQFVRMKTLAILVHKNAIPAAIKAKLGIK